MFEGLFVRSNMHLALPIILVKRQKVPPHLLRGIKKQSKQRRVRINSIVQSRPWVSEYYCTFRYYCFSFLLTLEETSARSKQSTPINFHWREQTSMQSWNKIYNMLSRNISKNALSVNTLVMVLKQPRILLKSTNNPADINLHETIGNQCFYTLDQV